MENKLDIVQLIERNPITRLSSNYQGKFINKIKNVFTESQQHLFVSSFYIFLNHSKDEYVIDLDYIWKWLGFERKCFCKKVLEKHFVINIDYKIFVAAGEARKENLLDGLNKENSNLQVKVSFTSTGENPNLKIIRLVIICNVDVSE